MTPPAVAPGSRRLRHRFDSRLCDVPGFGPSIGSQINTQPEPRVVTFTYRNTEVLAALQKLTGQDFDYDIAAWRDG